MRSEIWLQWVDYCVGSIDASCFCLITSDSWALQAEEKKADAPPADAPKPKKKKKAAPAPDAAAPAADAPKVWDDECECGLLSRKVCAV